MQWQSSEARSCQGIPQKRIHLWHIASTSRPEVQEDQKSFVSAFFCKLTVVKGRSGPFSNKMPYTGSKCGSFGNVGFYFSMLVLQILPEAGGVRCDHSTPKLLPGTNAMAKRKHRSTKAAIHPGLHGSTGRGLAQALRPVELPLLESRVSLCNIPFRLVTIQLKGSLGTEL